MTPRKPVNILRPSLDSMPMSSTDSHPQFPLLEADRPCLNCQELANRFIPSNSPAHVLKHKPCGPNGNKREICRHEPEGQCISMHGWTAQWLDQRASQLRLDSEARLTLGTVISTDRRKRRTQREICLNTPISAETPRRRIQEAERGPLCKLRVSH